jgi:hypothetical protein
VARRSRSVDIRARSRAWGSGICKAGCSTRSAKTRNRSLITSDSSQEAAVVALACGPPPKGEASWSTRLIAEEVSRRASWRVLLQTFPLAKGSQSVAPENRCRGNTVLVKSGEAPYHEGSACVPPNVPWECWSETTAMSVDPSDDTAIWMAQEYPVPVPGGFNSNYVNYSVWVAQAFGGASSCGHGVCQSGGPMPSGCDSVCVTPVCAQDPYCCNQAWDNICVSEVPTYCGGNVCQLSP